MKRREFLSLASVPLMAGQPDPARATQAGVKPYRGAPTLFLDSRPASYAALWVSAPAPDKWESAAAARLAAEAGIHTYAFDVGSGIEWAGPAPGRTIPYDFTTLEARFGRILEVDPQARMHLRCQLEIGADDWWSKLYPDELELHSNGRRYTQSFASLVWRDQAKQFLRAYIQRLGETGLLDHVIAFQVGAGHTGEWVKGETSMYTVCGDYSAPMRRRFREWLRSRYHADIAQLREAWNDPDIAFETAEAPGAQEQLNARQFIFRDPRQEQKVIDYFRCLAELCAEALTDFCRTIKEATEGRKLAGAFYGYLLELAWNGGFFAERPDSDYSTYQRSGHLGLRVVLDSPYVDFLVSPYSYGFRHIGGDGPSMLPAESARLHGKLVIIEDDTRTHIDSDPNYGRAADLAESVAILRRNFAGAVTRGQGMWWASWKIDPAREPAFLPLLKECERLGSRLVHTDRTSAAEVAVLVDDESLYYETSLNYFDVPGIFQQRLWGLPHMGTPFDVHLLQDLADGRLRAYKLYVFLNAFRLDRARRENLAGQLCRDHRVALWIYAPGYVQDDLSPEHMTDLTGFRFGLGERPWGPLVHITQFEHPISKGLPQDLFWGTNSKLGPLFYVDDPSATVLGQVVYSQGNCKPGFAVKTFPNWTSVYAAAPNIPAGVLRNVARFAGAHIYSDDGDAIYASHDLLGVHTVSGGARLLRLPHAVKEVVDLYQERTVARDTAAFEVELPPAATAFYLLRHGL
jgi:hypothetical protein